MFYTERHEQIIKILRQRSSASVHYLAKALFMSEPTIRRDLKILEGEGKIKRTFGGAVLCENINKEIPLALRERENMKAKEEIAKRAARLITDGSVVFLDASSTVLKMTEYLSGLSNITVITNSPRASMSLAEKKIKSFCTGGLLLESSIAYIGDQARRFVSNFNADMFFFSSRGISGGGIITDSSVEETELRRTMLESSEKHIFLCDGKKIGKKYMYKLCSLNRVDEIISDASYPPEFENMLRR